MPTGFSSSRWIEAETPEAAAVLIESGFGAALAGMLARREITSEKSAHSFSVCGYIQYYSTFKPPGFLVPSVLGNWGRCGSNL